MHKPTKEQRQQAIRTKLRDAQMALLLRPDLVALREVIIAKLPDSLKPRARARQPRE